MPAGAQADREGGEHDGERRGAGDLAARLICEGAAVHPVRRLRGGGRDGYGTVRGGAHGEDLVDARPALREGLRTAHLSFGVEVAADAGVGEAEFAGLPDRAPQRAAVVRADGGRVGRPGRRAVPGAQPERQGAARQFADRRGEPGGRGDGHRRAPSRVRSSCWTSR